MANTNNDIQSIFQGSSLVDDGTPMLAQKWAVHHKQTMASSTAATGNERFDSCLNCFRNKALVTFRPCGHKCVCNDCGIDMKKCLECCEEVVERTLDASFEPRRWVNRIIMIICILNSIFLPLRSLLSCPINELCSLNIFVNDLFLSPLPYLQIMTLWSMSNVIFPFSCRRLAASRVNNYLLIKMVSAKVRVCLVTFHNIVSDEIMIVLNVNYYFIISCIYLILKFYNCLFCLSAMSDTHWQVSTWLDRLYFWAWS